MTKERKTRIREQPLTEKDTLSKPSKALKPNLPTADFEKLAKALSVKPNLPTADFEKLAKVLSLKPTSVGLNPNVRHKNQEHIKSTKDLGYLVRTARREMGLSQQQLSDLAGVGRRFVSELENGKATLELNKVVKVCNAVGIDIYAARR